MAISTFLAVASSENNLSTTWTRDFTWLWESILTYDWQINDKNRLNLLGGITAQKYTNEKLGKPIKYNPKC